MREGIALAVVAVLSWAIAGRVRRYALKQGMLDVPNERSSHVSPTPRGGGFGFVVTTLAGFFLLFLGKDMPLAYFMALFIGGALVAAIGFWDDCLGVRARVKIIVHLIAAIWAVKWYGEGLPTGLLSGGIWDIGWAGFFGFVVLLVWMLNLYNFMDGIDGIAAVEAVTAAGGAALILFLNGSQDVSLWLALVAAGAAGFLVWNWPPAKVFMGDVGSGFLGFVMGALALLTIVERLVSVWSWLILLGVFVTDATLTLLKRMVRGDKWYYPHRCHAYQHAARRWGSHRTVTLAVAAINVLWLLPLAWISATFAGFGPVLTGLALLPLVVLAHKLGAGLPE